MELVWFVIGAMWGASVLYWILASKFNIERKHKHSWTCPYCSVVISTQNDLEILQQVVDIHIIRRHTGGLN